MRRTLLLTLLLLASLVLAACPAAQPAAAPAQEAAAPAAPAAEATKAPEAEPTKAPEAEPTKAPEPEPTHAPAEEPAAMAEEECAKTFEGETITLYQQAGLTGPLATILGSGFIGSTKDAVDAINAAGGVCGVMLDIRLEDTQYAPEQEVAVYETFRAEEPKPLMVFTYGSGATIALKDRVVEDQIVNFAAGLNAEAFYNPANGWTVGIAPIYSDQFAGFLELIGTDTIIR